MTGDRYRIIIVGAGPAGIFAAMELASRGIGGVLILEQGPDLPDRKCPDQAPGAGCRVCGVCHVLSGWGGAGAFSDGKLTLSSAVGGFLGDYLSRAELEELVGHVDGIFLRFGAPSRVYRPEAAAEEVLTRAAAASRLVYVPSPVRHMGTDGSRAVLERMRDFLRTRADVVFGERVERILVEDGRAAGVETASGRLYRAPAVVLAPGRAGVEWLSGEGRRLGLPAANNPVDIGLRLECRAGVMKPLTDAAYEVKLHFTSSLFRDHVRTFCMCPYGEVVMESVNGLLTVNGQSYAGHRTENTNFALLVSTRFTRPFDAPITYGRHVAGLANLLSGGILVQRLGDLSAGRRSTEERLKDNPVRPTLKSAVPGDLSFALPYRHLADLREMIEAMEGMAPGLNRPETLLYGIEAKFYSIRLGLSPGMETPVGNLFAVGDGAGVSRGLVQAAASGVVAARAIGARI